MYPATGDHLRKRMPTLRGVFVTKTGFPYKGRIHFKNSFAIIIDIEYCLPGNGVNGHDGGFFYITGIPGT